MEAAAFGRDLDRNADCRGGVFAVFAKIPPPIPSPAAHPIEASIPCGDSRMVMSAQRVFVATWRAASRFRRRVVIKIEVSVGGMVYVYCDGRGNLRVAKTPPLQSALRGDRWGDYRTTIIDAPWASMGNGVEANNNAARRGVIKTRGSHRWVKAG